MNSLSSSVKILLTLIMLTTSAPWSFSQEKKLPETNGSFYAISVKNLEKAVVWYTNNLNFTMESRAENDERKGALLTRQDIILELAEFSSAVERNDLEPKIQSHEIYGIFKIGFITDDLDNSFKTLKEYNVEIFFPIVKLDNGRRSFGIKDLEGNIIQFFGE